MLYKHFPNLCWSFLPDPLMWLSELWENWGFFSNAVIKLVLGDSKYTDFPNILPSHFLHLLPNFLNVCHILTGVAAGESANRISHRGPLCSFTLFPNTTPHSVFTLNWPVSLLKTIVSPYLPSHFLSVNWSHLSFSVYFKYHLPSSHAVWLSPGIPFESLFSAWSYKPPQYIFIVHLFLCSYKNGALLLFTSLLS